MKGIVVATVFAVYLISVYCKPDGDQPLDNGICTQTITKVVYEVHEAVTNKLCWSWTFRCQRVIYRRNSYTVYMLNHMCCTGYTNSSDGGCEPYCENCHSPKMCTAPNKCKCPPGWSGESCSEAEDINECLTDNGGCEQNCTNTHGSYSCSCLPNFILDDNKHNCTELINVEVFFEFIDNSSNEERFLLKWNVPSAIPEGALLECLDSHNTAILQQNITNFTTVLKLDFDGAVSCCLPALSTENKCVSFNTESPSSNPQNSNSLIDNTQLRALFGGVGGAIILLILLLIVIIIIVIVYKGCTKSKRKKSLRLLTETTSSYTNDNESYGTDGSEINVNSTNGDHLSSAYSQIHSRVRRVQYATIRFDNNRSQATAGGKSYLELKTVDDSTDDNGYLRVIN